MAEKLSQPMSEQNRLTGYLDGFASYLETSTRLLPTTRRRYRYEVEAFARLMGNPPLEGVTPSRLLDWNARFHQAGYAASTVMQKHCALARFLTYLQEFQGSEHAGRLLNVLQKQLQVPRSKGPVRPAYVLEVDRLDRMLDAISRRFATGVRDRAMIHFLYSAGVRNFELTGLEMQGLDLRNRLATVVGKGDKERVVVFDQACQGDLERWLEDRKTWPTHSDYVFCSVDGTRLTPQTVAAIVREANKRAGFRKAVWPHVFRHTRITELLNNGMSLQDAAVIAGHSDVNTTMRYFHQQPTRLKEEYDRATPAQEA